MRRLGAEERSPADVTVDFNLSATAEQKGGVSTAPAQPCWCGDSGCANVCACASPQVVQIPGFQTRPVRLDPPSFGSSVAKKAVRCFSGV